MLSALRLSQFRCFEALHLELEPGMTVFIGSNAQGKTSILESVCVLLRLHSPRTSSLGELIQFGQQGFGLSGVWEGRTLGVTHEKRRRRRLFHGREELSRSQDYLELGGLVVWMGNEDSALVAGGGAGRRRYLDFQAAQLYPGYRWALRSYEKALRSRNELLKRGESRPDWGSIDAYTRVLLDHGEVLIRQRRALVEALRQPLVEAHATISERGEELTATYVPGGGEDFAAALAAQRERDLRRGQTHVGPHRDDLVIALDGRPAGRFASEGQQRTIALALKLGQLALLREVGGKMPMVLVDDVFGELDPARREALTGALPSACQQLITTTSLRWLPGEGRLRGAVYEVEAGTARRVGEV